MIPFRLAVVFASDHAAAARGEAPAGLLSPSEHRFLATLRFPVRRAKWLLGRLAAKRVLGEHLVALRGVAPLPTDVTVANEESGAPYAELAGEGRLPFTLSISHRETAALAVVHREPGRAIGADLELVRPRDPALVRQFFTSAEAAEVAGLSGRAADLAVARIWSAKEAMAKAMRVGLRIDLATLEVVGADTAAPPGWKALAVRSAAMIPEGEMPVLWRDDGDSVVTIAVP